MIVDTGTRNTESKEVAPGHWYYKPKREGRVLNHDIEKVGRCS